MAQECELARTLIDDQKKLKIVSQEEGSVDLDRWTKAAIKKYRNRGWELFSQSDGGSAVELVFVSGGPTDED